MTIRYEVGRTYRARNGADLAKPFTDRTIVSIEKFADGRDARVVCICLRTIVDGQPRRIITGLSALRKWAGSDVTEEVART
jgi:hypothetical protein